MPAGPAPRSGRAARWRRRVVVVVALALAITAWVVVARAEQQRTDTQVQTLRDALIHDATQLDGRYGPDRGGFLGSLTNGTWGQARVPRTTDGVLRDLHAGAESASIDAPFCVSPEERRAGDRIDVEARIAPRDWACDLTRGGRPFGWAEIGQNTWNDDGTPSTVLEYGIGPDAGYRGLDELSSTP